MKLPAELRPISGTDYYFAGSDGHIYSFNTTRGHHPRQLKGAIDRHGYRFVNFFRFGVMKSRKVHALVCEAFHGQRPEDKPVTRHLDGRRQNNLPENLCWGTAKENSEDMVKHGSNRRERRLNAGQVKEILSRSEVGDKQRDIAHDYKVSAATISHIVTGRLWAEVTHLVREAR